MEVMWKLVLAVALLCLTAEAQIRCKDKDNKDVDWYILYKLPNSVKYFYMDPSKEDDKLQDDIDHQAGPLANTLEPHFSKKPGSGYIAYNDQTPTCNALEEFGHSKGFVMTDKTSGFWLLHSTPRFPDGTASNKFYPSSGKTKAQTFICVTFKYDTFKDIGEHLRYIKAHVFKKKIPDDFHQHLRDAANGAALDPNTQTVFHKDLTSDGGQMFRSFFKRVLNREDVTDEEEEEEVGDLYVTIAENIGSDLYAQTWGCQHGKSDSYCPDDGKHVHNVEEIKMVGTEWKRTVDHSKWCVSENKGWTCFGDSNRAKSQYNRPGGAVCINDPRVGKKFRSFIDGFDGCSKPPPSKKAKSSTDDCSD